MDPSQDNDIPRRLGVYVQPGIGQAYPELAMSVRDIMVERVSKIPFLPAGWLDEVLRLIDTQPLTLVKVYPALKADGVTPNDLAPSWVKESPERLKVWQELSEITRLAQFNYAQARVEEGRAIMAKANADAAFWDRAYNVAVFIRDAPGNAVSAVAGGALSFVGSFPTKTWWVWAIVGVLAFAWFARGSIAAKVARKAGVGA
jgi:hypothetical protein